MVEKLTSEFQHAQELTQSQVATPARSSELQAKLDNREPRPEDVQLIESLRRQMKEKDEMVRRAPRGRGPLARSHRSCRCTRLAARLHLRSANKPNPN